MSKKLLIGLEYEKIEDQYYTPTVRILGKDYNGVAFGEEEWRNFIGTFEDVTKYLEGQNIYPNGTSLAGHGWRLLFTTAHKDRAIEIEQDDDHKSDANCTTAKKFRHSVVLKKVSFDNLFRLCQYVNARIEYLNTVKGSVSCIVNEYINLLRSSSASFFESQAQTFDLSIIERISEIASPDDDVKMIISKVVEKIKALENQAMLSAIDIKMLTSEFYAIHMENILQALNNVPL